MQRVFSHETEIFRVKIQIKLFSKAFWPYFSIQPCRDHMRVVLQS